MEPYRQRGTQHTHTELNKLVWFLVLIYCPPRRWKKKATNSRLMTFGTVSERRTEKEEKEAGEKGRSSLPKRLGEIWASLLQYEEKGMTTTTTIRIGGPKREQFSNFIKIKQGDWTFLSPSLPVVVRTTLLHISFETPCRFMSELAY